MEQATASNEPGFGLNTVNPGSTGSKRAAKSKADLIASGGRRIELNLSADELERLEADKERFGIRGKRWVAPTVKKVLEQNRSAGRWKIPSPDDVEIYQTRSCFVLSLPSLENVLRIPYLLKGGELLSVGDRFLSTDNGKGAAGTQGVKMADGWYQQYEGITLAPWLRDKKTRFVLFTAWNERGIPATDGEFEYTHDHQFIGYIDHDGSWFHMRGSSSTNVAPCNTLERYDSDIMEKRC